MIPTATLRALVVAFLLFVTHPATAMNKGDFAYDVGYAKSLVTQGKEREAIAYMEKLSVVYGGAQGHYENELGNFYSNARLYDKAEKAYLDGIALKGNYPRPYIGLAFVCLEQNRHAEAEKWARRAVDEFPGWWVGYTTAGHIAWKQKRLPAAKTWLQRSLDIERRAQTLWFLAIVSYELKEWQSVVDSMNAAIDLDNVYSGEENGMKLTAIAFAQLGRYRDAYRIIETLKTNNPDIGKAYIQSLRENVETLERRTVNSVN